MNRLSGKSALVTGGASGIGEAVTKQFIREGASVIIADVQVDKGQQLAVTLGASATFVKLNVADESDWREQALPAVQQRGRLDIVVNSAGVAGPGSIEDIQVQDWRRVTEINLLGSILGCRFAVELMKRSGGSIINVASVAGVRAVAEEISYTTSKAAVIQLTRAVALHCGRHQYKIRCNSVLPGAVDTPMLRTLEFAFGGAENLEKAVAGLHALNRMGRPDEIAAVVTFLASDEASFVTAADYAVDGGMIQMWGR